MSDILVTPAQLSTAAVELRRYAEIIRSSLEAVDGQISRLGPEEFAGKRAEALRERYRACRGSLYEFPEWLLNYARLLDNGAEAFTQADRGGAP